MDLPTELSVPGDQGLRSTLFGETPSRVIVAVTAPHVETLLTRARAADVPAHAIGQTGGDRLRVAVGGESVLDLAVAELEQIWATGLSRYFDTRAA